VYVAPTCARSTEGSDHLGLMYAAFPAYTGSMEGTDYLGCFHDLKPRPHGHKAIALPLCHDMC
jgi:hypothetical protein